MKSPTHSNPHPNQLSAASERALQRSRIMVEQFPEQAGPAAAMVFVGMAILAATAAMFWLAEPREDSTSAAASVRNPASVEEREIAAAGDNGADATEGAEKGPSTKRELAGSGETAAPQAEEAQPAFRSDRVAAGSAIFQPSLPSEREIASVLATPEPASDDASSVAVAETTEELLALEEIQRREVEADLGSTSPETTAAVRTEPAPKVAATATTWVNLRAGPSDDAEVLMVVPGNAEIRAEAGCNWCAVAYDGREGYIYKTFINY